MDKNILIKISDYGLEIIKIFWCAPRVGDVIVLICLLIFRCNLNVGLKIEVVLGSGLVRYRIK